MKQMKRTKYAMIISWIVSILAAIVFCSVNGYFFQQGYQTDEDWLESGLTESIWSAVFIVSEMIALLGGIIAVITSIIYFQAKCTTNICNYEKNSIHSAGGDAGRLQ